MTGTAAALPARVDCWVPARMQATTGYGDTVTAPRHAELRGHRQRLAPAALRAQVALGAPSGPASPMWDCHPVGTPGTQPMVRVNPALWRGRPEQATRLLSLDV